MASPLSNVDSIPAVMRARDQWLLWRYEQRGGKTTKVPYQLNGEFAKVNDPSTWCSFDELQNAPASMSGIGFAFAEGDHLVGLDLDHCVNPYSGDIEPWAAEIVKLFNKTYIEFSPSRAGLHIICNGRALKTGNKKFEIAGQKYGIEVYDYRSPRYFTVTGEPYQNLPLSTCQDALEQVFQAYFADAEPTQHTPSGPVPQRQIDESALIDALNEIDPDEYSTWIKVGMALKAGGYDCDLWDRWSANSLKYQQGVCEKKWRTFKGQGVGIGSVFHLAGKRAVYTQSTRPVTTIQPRRETPLEDFSPQTEEDFTVREWPTLQDDALHGLAGRIVRASVESSEADPAAVLATLLVRCGATFGRNSWTKIGDDRHYPLLFGMVVGASANARKGTSLGPVERIFEDAESRDPGPKLHVTNGLSSGEGLIAAIRDAKPETESEDEDEGVSDKRLLVIESEFAGPLKAMQRQGNTLSVVIRDAWDRRKLSIMTKNNPLTATDGHIGMLGHITKYELVRLMEKVELSNGLVNRFLWFCSRRSKILAFPEGLNEQVIPELAHDLYAAIRHGQKQQMFNFDGEAAEYYRELYYTVTTQESGGIIGDITARGPAQIRRIALIYCIMDCDKMIRIEHLKAAHAVWNYCLASAKWIFGASTTTNVAPTLTLNERVLKALQAGEKTQSELTSQLKKVAKAADLATALSELQSIGRISQRKGDTYSQGGRAPIYWQLTEVK